jgi:hypothetical protein
MFPNLAINKCRRSLPFLSDHNVLRSTAACTVLKFVYNFVLCSCLGPNPFASDTAIGSTRTLCIQSPQIAASLFLTGGILNPESRFGFHFAESCDFRYKKASDESSTTISEADFQSSVAVQVQLEIAQHLNRRYECLMIRCRTKTWGYPKAFKAGSMPARTSPHSFVLFNMSMLFSEPYFCLYISHCWCAAG